MIHIITTGGTIQGLDYISEDKKTNSKTKDIKDFLDAANVTIEYSIENVLNKDSRFISIKDRELIESSVKKSHKDKVLITHGTYTMIETAVYLGRQNIKKVILLTGSFTLGTDPKSDAAFNLGFAISALQLLKKGVYIVMNGSVFEWNNVVKNEAQNRFETIKD